LAAIRDHQKNKNICFRDCRTQ